MNVSIITKNSENSQRVFKIIKEYDFPITRNECIDKIRQNLTRPID